MLLLIKNSSKNCLAGKIFVYFLNVVLWVSLYYVVYIVSTTQTSHTKKILGVACILGMFADYHWMSRFVPVLTNPFKKDDNGDGNGGGNYLSDIEAATKEAKLPGATLENLF